MRVSDSVYAIQRGYLDHICPDRRRPIWSKIASHFEEARKLNHPKPVLVAYSLSQEFTKQINSDMAKNTYHELTLYCTPLNCHFLARTQDGIQAFITILFDPSLKKHLCVGTLTVYRGFAVDNESVLDGYEKDAIIITTTFLSTSRELAVAKSFTGGGSDDKTSDQIFILCTYRIRNHRRTALDMMEFSKFPGEHEILIYPYVPFRILSYVKKTPKQNGKQQIEVELEELGDEENNDGEMQSIWTVSTNV